MKSLLTPSSLASHGPKLLEKPNPDKPEPSNESTAETPRRRENKKSCCGIKPEIKPLSIAFLRASAPQR
jgi:hypothetical protein